MKSVPWIGGLSWRRRGIATAVGVVLIFLFALGIRFFTFFLQHWQGDQSQYVGLAMKYDSLGMNGFNLDQMEIRQMTFAAYPDWQFTYPKLTKTPGQSDYYQAYDKFGLEFNKMPLHHKSPLFPVALAVSHHLFAARGQPFVVVKTPIENKIKLIQFKKVFFTSQFWAVVVPLLSSLLGMLLTFFFARRLFGDRVALCAMLFLAIHPVGIVTSYKILSDDFVTFFVVAALFIFYIAHEDKNLFLALISGCVAGLAILAKQSAVLIFPSVAVYLLLASEEKWYHPRTWLYFLLFLGGAIFISAHWFIRVYGVYGDPFYQPQMEEALRRDKSGWFGLLSYRQSAFMLFLVNVPLLCPPFFFGHLSFQNFIKALWPGFPPKKERRAVLFLWLWVLPFLLFFTFRLESKEERYLLPVYPALAMLSAYGLNAMQERFARHFSRPRLVGAVVAVFLALSIAWSVPIGLETVFKERFLILEPLKLAKLFYSSKNLSVG